MDATLYCGRTGKLHSELSASNLFCPDCRAPLRKQREAKSEAIIIDDSPEPRASLYIPFQNRPNAPSPSNPYTRAPRRTVAENARQQSIQRTSIAARTHKIATNIVVVSMQYARASNGKYRYASSQPIRTKNHRYSHFPWLIFL